MPGLEPIEHVVVLMLENRSFDHMLGYLYADAGNTSPAGDAFEGLAGKESCPDSSGSAVEVYRITPSTPHAYFMPGADPGEGYANTNAQMFGSTTAPKSPTVPTMQGFVTNYEEAIADNKRRHWYVIPGTTPSMIMGCFDPTALPVLSALARGFAVCDHWYGSAPTMTMPNRAFACAGTSQGHMDDEEKSFTSPSIFGALSDHGVSWKVYGYDKPALTLMDFPDTKTAPAANSGFFSDFQADARAGSLPAYAFLEPSWTSTGNSQHPNYNVALGEQLLLDTYRAVSGGPDWPSTLLIITYDEHGGCFDHVAPPWGATPPDSTAGEYGFDFTRFGPRVPTILVSPLIPAGTVFRVPDGSVPLDHTSILATVEHRFSIPALTRRDAAAPDVGAVLSLDSPRTDDPLAGVTAPTPPPTPTALAAQESHLEQIRTELVARTHALRNVPMVEEARFHHYARGATHTQFVLAAAGAKAWDVPALCQAYHWPTNLAGGGTIAIVELGGGWVQADIDQYFEALGQPSPKVTDVSVDGTRNTPNKSTQSASDPDVEVALDIEVAGAAYYAATGKPGTIRMYWSQDIASAVARATADGCDVCSISWGADEAEWGKDKAEAMESTAAAATNSGLVVFAAAGDNDSSDGGPGSANVDLPASAPHVVGCGGTKKTSTAETVWNDNPGHATGEGTGGGYSTLFPAQSWQTGVPTPPSGLGRMVPDVAANADPATGYNIVVHGKATIVGGTSAVAPLYAGLFASFGEKLGFVTPRLYGDAAAFHDITSGDNGLYNAGTGPDPCTGLGSPIANRLAALLASEQRRRKGTGAHRPRHRQ